MQNPQSPHILSTTGLPAAPIGVLADIVTTDPAEFEQALRPWELWCKPAEAGNFQHRVTMLQTPMFMIYREWFSLRCHLQGLTPPGMLGFAIPTEAGCAAHYWNLSHNDVSMPATLPGPLDARILGGHRQLVFFMQLEPLRQALPEPIFESLKQAAENHFLQASPHHLRNLETWGNRLLYRFSSSPELSRSPDILETYYRELIDQILLLSGQLLPASCIDNKMYRRSRGLHKVLEYMRESPDVRFSLPELCRIAGISERSLQYAFRETFGHPPAEVMMRRRLHLARRELLFGDRAETSVTQVALKFGFTELGRFADRYKRLFGELPSETLRKER